MLVYLGKIFENQFHRRIAGRKGDWNEMGEANPHTMRRLCFIADPTFSVGDNEEDINFGKWFISRIV